MPAATKGRGGSRKIVDRQRQPLGLARAWRNAMFTYASGNVVPAGAVVGKVRGVFMDDVDNSIGPAGSKQVNCEMWPGQRPSAQFLVANDVGTPVTAANIGSVCYALDDSTVTAAVTAGKEAGIVRSVATEGVFVELGVFQ